MTVLVFVLVLLVQSVSGSDIDEDLIVKLAQGPLFGTEKANRVNKKPYYAFLGIPYAKPPVGEKRFKDPEEPLPWTGILNASIGETSCMTYNLLFKFAEGSEDCLFLNIFTPKKPKDLQNSPLPVMVWIHSGGFIWGAGTPSNFGPDFLMMHSVLLVLINYRLNVFGFLSVSTDHVPGNAGLKDQVMALKWIQENIREFGGDPNRVTIFGESAGGASVHYLMLSPSAKGLFHRAIAQSGVAINPWASTGDTLEIAYKIGKVFDCHSKNTYELVSCLQQVRANELVAYQFNILSIKSSEFLTKSLSLPCVEATQIRRAFLAEHPAKVMEEGNFNDVPFMLGPVRRETLMMDVLFTVESIPNSLRTLVISQLNKNPHLLLPRNLIFESNEKFQEAGKKLKEFYFQNKPVCNETSDNLIDLTTDSWFNLGVYDTAKLHSKFGKSPVYFYQFTLETEFGESEKQITVNKPGPSHADDVKYFFYKWDKEIEITPEEMEKISAVESLWVNFATFGNPTPEGNSLGLTWEPFSSEKQSYLEIGDELIMKVDFEKDRMQFWENLIKEGNLTYYK